MYKLRTLQLPLIILLTILLTVLFFQYRDVVDENSVLKSKFSEYLLVSKNTPQAIKSISDNYSEPPRNQTVLKTKVANKITEKDIVKVNQNTEVVPFEDQEVDNEWATLVETAVTDVFYTSNLLVNYTLDNVECRSSVCKVRMPKNHDDIFHQSGLVLSALEEVGIKYSSISFGSDVEEGNVVFYFSKHEI
jgi:hypothetical protein